MPDLKRMVTQDQKFERSLINTEGNSEAATGEIGPASWVVHRFRKSPGLDMAVFLANKKDPRTNHLSKFNFWLTWVLIRSGLRSAWPLKSPRISGRLFTGGMERKQTGTAGSEVKKKGERDPTPLPPPFFRMHGLHALFFSRHISCFTHKKQDA